MPSYTHQVTIIDCVTSLCPMSTCICTERLSTACVRAANAYIMVSPKNTTAMEGRRVRLVCQAEAHPNNITYQWFRDGVDVHLVTGLMARAGIYGDGSFIISSVQRTDTGWYRCQPTNGLGTPPSADAFLNVTCE